MFDIGPIFTPFDLALIALMIFGPGLARGALVGTRIWHCRLPNTPKQQRGLTGPVIAFKPEPQPLT